MFRDLTDEGNSADDRVVSSTVIGACCDMVDAGILLVTHSDSDVT